MFIVDGWVNSRKHCAEVHIMNIHELRCRTEFCQYFSVPEHGFRELQEDLLVLLEMLPGI